MINPNNIMTAETGDSDQQTLKITNIPDYDFMDYDLGNPKGFKKYTDDIEHMCRYSFEYRNWVYYLREYMGMNTCSFMSDVSNAETFKIKIHLHHSPLTLYDIVMAVYNKRLDKHEPLQPTMVSKEVMYHHYMTRVGIIPVCETVHELIHNKFLFVPTTAVFGKYWEFVDIFRNYIDPCMLETLCEIEEHSKTYDMNQAKEILKTNLIYIDTSEVFEPNSLDKVKTMLRDHIASL